MSKGTITSAAAQSIADSESAPVELKVDGLVLQRTSAGLAKSRPPGEIETAVYHTQAFITKVARAYSRDVAAGEIGYGGTSVADLERRNSKKFTTGLLYGRIQSGKTQGMILSTALAIDNGFKVVVILTSDSVELVEQTAQRFALLRSAGVMVYDITKKESWPSDANHIRENLHKLDKAFTIICSKNKHNLDTLTEFLKTVEAFKRPALIFDDEADQASLDTSARKRSKEVQNGGDADSIAKSAINEAVDSLRSTLDHHVFIQVTATPFAMFLLNGEDVMRPSFVHLLEPGTGYHGGDKFFGDEAVEFGKPPLVYVEEEEISELKNPAGDRIPEGLKKAVSYFVLTAAYDQSRPDADTTQTYNMLCHPSHTQDVHNMTREKIASYLGIFQRFMETGEGANSVQPYLNWAMHQLKMTIPDLPDFESLKGLVRLMIGVRQVLVINTEGSGYQPAPGLNFVIGGNIIGRGLTIENLLVTYYIRPTQIAQMDTMYQHARMFGYRSKIFPLMRVFLPSRLAARFRCIHDAETLLRSSLIDSEQEGAAIHVGQGLRPTRPNVLDQRFVVTYGPGAHVYPSMSPDYDRAGDKKYNEICKEISALVGGGSFNGYKEVPLSVIKDLIRAIDVHEDDDNAGSWDTKSIFNTLDSLEDVVDGKGAVCFRTMSRSTKNLPTGALYGDELKIAREFGKPVLFIIKDESLKARAHKFVYPTVVLPKSMMKIVSNKSVR